MLLSNPDLTLSTKSAFDLLSSVVVSLKFAGFVTSTNSTVFVKAPKLFDPLSHFNTTL